MRVVFASAAVLTGLVFSTATMAATVTPLAQEVLLNLGTGFQRIVQSVPAGTGAIVQAGPTGSAHIRYEDGCDYIVSPNEVYRIDEESPCRLANIVGTGLIAAFLGTAIFLATDDDDKPSSP